MDRTEIKINRTDLPASDGGTPLSLIVVGYDGPTRARSPYGNGGWLSISVNGLSQRDDEPTTVVGGHDLWLLREALNKLPEAAFVAPLPPRWTNGDVVRLHGSDKPEKIWVREHDRWFSGSHPDSIADPEINAVVDAGSRCFRRAEILRQKSGQDTK